jgi:hypothetical protein
MYGNDQAAAVDSAHAHLRFEGFSKVPAFSQPASNVMRDNIVRISVSEHVAAFQLPEIIQSAARCD